MKDPIYSEVRDLLSRGTFKVILKEELPDGANALTACFVLAIKSSADGQVKYKARYVIGSHRDLLKQYMLHGAETLQASYTRLILALATMLGFEVFHPTLNLRTFNPPANHSPRIHQKHRARVRTSTGRML